MSHTPGPWEAWAPRETDDAWGRFKRWQVRSSGRYNPVCTLPPKTGEADARLIAAAPDLLAALDEISDERRTDMVWMKQRARAAIAKAKGDS